MGMLKNDKLQPRHSLGISISGPIIQTFCTTWLFLQTLNQQCMRVNATINKIKKNIKRD